MAANVLNSERAVEMSLYVVRAFIRLREAVLNYKELSGRLGELERRVSGHDADMESLLHVIKQLMEPPPEKPKRRIGFGR